jgi:hypothetical protein
MTGRGVAGKDSHSEGCRGAEHVLGIALRAALESAIQPGRGVEASSFTSRSEQASRNGEIQGFATAGYSHKIALRGVPNNHSELSHIFEKLRTASIYTLVCARNFFGCDVNTGKFHANNWKVVCTSLQLFASIAGG